jgi:hypothetical protein
MLGLAYYEADKCPGCGRSLTDSTHGEESDWLVTKHTCHACEMLAIKQKAEQGKYPSAEMWTVERA